MTGRMADAVLAAYHAGEVALRLLKPGIEVCFMLHSDIII